MTAITRPLPTAFEPATPSKERGAARRLPPLNLYEDDDGWLVVVDLPGVPHDRLDVTVESGALQIRGEQAERPDASASWLPARFARTITLPEGADVAAIAATLEMGVLTLTLPKLAAVKPRRIEVRAG